MTAKLSALTCACTLTLGLASLQAAIIDSVRNSGGQGQRSKEYVWGEDPFLSTNTYVLKNTWRLQSSDTFVGQLEITTNGTLGHWNQSRRLTMTANTVLNGGTIAGNSEATGQSLIVDGGGFDFAMQDGTLSARAGRGLRIEDADLSGDGDIEVTGAGVVKFQDVDTTGFTGSFNVTGSTFNLDTITTASFGLSLSSAGVYANDADAAFTSLTIMGSAVANGTYTRSELLTYGTDEYSQNWSAFVADGGGNITVVPEPGSYALLGGCLALAWVMVRRRRA